MAPDLSKRVLVELAGAGELRGEWGLGHRQAERPGRGHDGSLGALHHLGAGSDLAGVHDVRVRSHGNRALDELVTVEGGHAVHDGVGVG